MLALVVDDTPANRDFLERLLKQARFDVKGADSGESALKLISDVPTLELAVVDMQLPDMNGLQLTVELRQKFPQAYIVIATMYDDKSLMDRAFSRGCNVFLVKPHGFMELFKRLTTQKMEDLLIEKQLVIDQYGPRPFTPVSR
jgi:CheY-like chemotaxis protein